MKKGKLKALYICRKDDTKDLIFDVVEINRTNALKEYYKLLNCNVIDIQERYINGKIYDLIFDDEGLINGKAQDPKNIIAFGALNGKITEMLFGELLICNKADENGEEISINDKDIENIIFDGQSQLTNSKTLKKYNVIQYEFFNKNEI